jgi:hypothetical protein
VRRGGDGKLRVANVRCRAPIYGVDAEADYLLMENWVIEWRLPFEWVVS